jgi:uncharacterized repeat protein (TIGR01451 family)
MTTKRITDKGGGIITTIVAGACLWLALSALPIYASDIDFTDGITVDSMLDAVDTSVGDSQCDDGAGNCTLRAAVMEANAVSGADTIILPAGVYTLTITGVDERCENPAYYDPPEDAVPCTGTGTPEDPYSAVISADASMGDLDITGDVSIVGAGAALTRIQWGVSPRDELPLTGDRIFHIQTTAATGAINTVSISGVTLLNGETGVTPTAADTVATPNAYDINVVNATPGEVHIWQFRRFGGAIGVGASYGVVEYIETEHGPGGGGGGAPDDGGPFPGGKPGEEDSLSIGQVSLNDVVVASNWCGADGGGVFVGAPTAIAASVISANTSNANGGGIYAAEPLTLDTTTIGSFDDAVPDNFPADISYDGNMGENGGGLFDTGSHTTEIRQSAINNNSAIGGGGIGGRSIVTINITNSTISSNYAFDVGGGITTNGTVNLKNSTVAYNRSDSDAPGGGGGLNSFGSGTYNFVNTILGGNAKSGGEGGDPVPSNCGCSGGDEACPTGRMVSQGHNIEDADTCDLDLAFNDQASTPPLLLALANDGGLTEVHALTFVAIDDPGNSPALDSGNDGVCPNNDQRGSIRPADGDEDGTANCDVGAYERSNLTTDLQIANMVAPDEVFKTDNYTVTVTILNNTDSDDTNVVLTFDTLPAGVTFVSAIPSTGSCSVTGGDVSCDIGTLLAGNSATVPLTLTADAVGDVTITATVSGVNADPELANNSHSVNTAIIGIADLELTATANATSVVVGNQVTVTFTVANLGADDATEVRLGGTIPPEATLISATPDNGTTCTQTGADVLCVLGNLAVAGPTINVVAVLRADEAGRVADVSASVDAKQRDPIESNNTVTASVTITSVPTGGSDSGGLCSYDPNGRFDPVLPLLVMLSLIYLARRRRVATQ